MAEETIRVLLTSIDGNLTHPFRGEQTVDDVRRFGYDKLVKDKAQIPFENTWIELLETRLDGSTRISSLVKPEKRDKDKGDDPDLTLSLVWTQQGGCC
jgi:hypothetical protein